MAKEYRTRNRDKVLAKKREHYYKNKDSILVSVKEYAKSERGIITRRLYLERNKKRNGKYRRLYERKRMLEDSQFKLAKNVRNRIRDALKSGYVSVKAVGLTGCSIKELKKHLELQFVPGMAWKNHGEWHIDHIIPCAAFDLSKLDQQKECFNFTNLQPLWATDNMKKGARFAI